MLSDEHNPVPVLSDFLSNVPPPLTFALVQLAPSISACKAAVQISSWSTSWYHSWLALASWWAVCLLLDNALRRFLPFVILAFFAFAQWRQRNQSFQLPETEQSLRTVITDLTIIQSLLPSLFSPPQVAISKLIRVSVVFYIPYLALTFFVTFRVICAIVGTALLTWRAPWAIILRATIWRSAWFRWSVYKAWAILSGDPLPAPTTSFQPSTNSAFPVQSLRFLFTIYENQRWWMGLDWTAALIPGERPSWCSASQHPISPPNAFTLPENTTVYLPDGKGGRIKRTATWKWEEPEWRVLVHRDGDPLSRVERPLPSVKEDSPNSSRLLKAAGRLRESGTLANINSSAASESNKSTVGNSDADQPAEDSQDNANDELLTDADGWVYGDNKWEGQSSRGGMGKYTRYRRWTRIAVVFEVVESVAAGDIGIQRDEPTPQTVDIAPEGFDHQRAETLPLSDAPESPLRQRLRMALSKPQAQ